MSSIQKLLAKPQRAVIALHITIETAKILTRLRRSANAAMGMPKNV
jgi:hypothetical protein